MVLHGWTPLEQVYNNEQYEKRNYYKKEWI